MAGRTALAPMMCAGLVFMLSPVDAQADAAGAVGWQNALVQARAGTWDVITTYTMDGLGPLLQDHAVSERTVAEGPVLIEQLDGTMLQAPYLGEARSGYDSDTDRYWVTWTDWTDPNAVSTVTFHGVYDAATATYYYQATVADPVMGAALMQIAWTIDGPDRETVVYMADSEELGPIEVMRSVYERRPLDLMPSAGGDGPGG